MIGYEENWARQNGIAVVDQLHNVSIYIIPMEQIQADIIQEVTENTNNRVP